MRDAAAEETLHQVGSEVFLRPDAWRSTPDRASLSGAFRTVPVPRGAGGLGRKLLAFAGPGFLVAVGYMDPGNWATDLAAGSAFGYRLLSVVLLSGMAAMLLQGLAAKLGVATGRDLAQACRDHFPFPVTVALWILAEIGICACDLAELIGTALALKLLFGLPLLAGVALTTLDVVAVLGLERFGFRRLEAMVLALIGIVALCFLAELLLAKPALGAVLAGFLPGSDLLTRPQELYLAVGVVGATIMPHNLYLHSSIVQTRRYALTPSGRREAVRLAGADSTLALGGATAVNAAILILAAAVFHLRGFTGVADISQAYRLLAPLVGAAAAVLFAIGLLASGQNSAVTATLAGQIVMEGFLNLRLPAWKRRLLTRLLAAAPALVVVALVGDAAVGKLLIGSQVVLALQLPFAVVPLVMFTSSRAKMGALANGAALSALAWAVAIIIVLLNGALLVLSR